MLLSPAHGDESGRELDATVHGDYHGIMAINQYLLNRFARLGDVAEVRVCLDAGVHVNVNDALWWAATYGNVEVVRMLLDAGANVHACHDAALSNAALLGQLQAVRALLAAGADPLEAWTHSTASSIQRQDMAKALDACADAMSPLQRASLATASPLFARLTAMINANGRRARLRR